MSRPLSRPFHYLPRIPHQLRAFHHNPKTAPQHRAVPKSAAGPSPDLSKLLKDVEKYVASAPEHHSPEMLRHQHRLLDQVEAYTASVAKQHPTAHINAPAARPSPTPSSRAPSSSAQARRTATSRPVKPRYANVSHVPRALMHCKGSVIVLDGSSIIGHFMPTIVRANPPSFRDSHLHATQLFLRREKLHNLRKHLFARNCRMVFVVGGLSRGIKDLGEDGLSLHRTPINSSHSDAMVEFVRSLSKEGVPAAKIICVTNDDDVYRRLPPECRARHPDALWSAAHNAGLKYAKRDQATTSRAGGTGTLASGRTDAATSAEQSEAANRDEATTSSATRTGLLASGWTFAKSLLGMTSVKAPDNAGAISPEK